MKLSFLRASNGRAAVKQFTVNGVKSYPNIKNFDSSDVELPDTIEGLHQKASLCQQAAAKGACMLKGHLTQPLENQSRAGMVDREAKTNNLILDIDGIELDGLRVTPPLVQADIQALAKAVIAKLPDCFHNVTYICHASSSMGMKGNAICLHLDFMLDEYVSPQALKEYVVWLNFNVPMFDGNQKLSASKTALRFALDRTVVDNSHLIFMGNPLFDEHVDNPIPEPLDRIFIIEGGRHAVDIVPELTKANDSVAIRKAIDSKITALRAMEGLPKTNEKVTQLRIDGYTTTAVINPEAVQMTYASDNGQFVAYNVNGGDSAGYYVRKHNPSVVYNFKGEPNFLFEKADPQTYEWHLKTFIESAEGGSSEDTTPPLPLVFRDEASNGYYNALVSTSTGQIARIARASRDGLADWMVQFESVMPENVPIWNFEFDPHRAEAVSFEHRFINKYIPSEYMRGGDLPEGTLPLTYDTSPLLSQDCPRIAELIMHVCGGDLACYKHFINWLAAALQTKDKLLTAWVFQGTQGTGKGVLFDHIIVPLVGRGVDSTQPLATQILLENIEAEFNQFTECALFIGLNEFRLKDSKQSERILNKIKSMITEKHQAVRAMRENHRMVRSYSNFILFSNDHDVIYIQEGDRRFNIAPRQEHKLRTIWPTEGDVIQDEIPAELGLFAKHMLNFKVDLGSAGTVLENDAKAEMRVTSRTSVEDFVRAYKEGDLDFFLPILDMPVDPMNTSYVRPAQNLMKSFLMDYGQANSKVTVEELRIIYNAFIGKSENGIKFSKMMNRYGMPSKKVKVRGTTCRGYSNKWITHENEIEGLRMLYLSANDLAFRNGEVHPIEDAI